MTPIDRFERQLPAALTDLADPRTPDYVTDILGLTARTRQRPAWASIERWLPMQTLVSPRLGLMWALVAGTIALIVGGLVLTAGGPPRSAPTVAPSPSASAAMATASPTASPAVLPAELLGGWVAPSRGTTIENLTKGTESALGGDAAVTTVVFMDSADFSPDAPAFWLDRRGTPLLTSTVAEETPGVVRFSMKTMADPNCVGKDSGTYRWSQTPDGQWLTFELIEDACETRGEILAGTWQRSLAHDSPGGPGIATVTEPYLTFTLPAATYRGRGLGGSDELVVDRTDDAMSFKVWQDLDGFVDPCDLSKGRLDIAPGMDAFLGYLRTDPRFTVTKEQELEIDGRRAVQVDFQLGADLSEPCWDFDGDPTNKSGVLLWVTGADPNLDSFWNGELDTPGTIVVTEVDGATLAFESVLVEPNGDLSTDLGLLDTVRFVTTLPEPPAGG